MEEEYKTDCFALMSRISNSFCKILKEFYAGRHGKCKGCPFYKTHNQIAWEIAKSEARLAEIKAKKERRERDRLETEWRRFLERNT